MTQDGKANTSSYIVGYKALTGAGTMKPAKPVFREKVGNIWSDITVDISREPCDPFLSKNGT